MISFNSRKGLINLFADYILNQFDKDLDTIISVTDYSHFFIVNGITESKNILDLSDLISKFISENEETIKSCGLSSNISIMDLIKYDKKNFRSKEQYLWCDLYNTDRPLIKDENIIQNNFNFCDEPLQITSEFPYGYSLSMGRVLMYYSELIGKKVLPLTLSNHMKLLISNVKNSDGESIVDLEIDSIIEKEKIISLILDIFDFDFTSFSKNFQNYNFCEDITNQSGDKFWLIKDFDIKDSIII